MENYKVKVNSEAENKEAQELFIQLGYKEPAQGLFGGVGIKSIQAWDDMDLTWGNDHGGISSQFKEITLPQLKDMVVLKRNDPKDENVYQDGDVPCLYNLYLTSDKNLYFFSCGKGWKLSAINDDDDYRKLLKPITKEPVMKEFLNPDQGYKLVCCAIGETSIPENWIEIPEGALIFAKARGSFLFYAKTGELVTPYKFMYLNDLRWSKTATNPKSSGGFVDEILWQRKTLNDKVASAEVARQSGMFVGTPFSDLPAFNFGAIDDFVESNVEQDNVNQPSHYCSHPSGIECIEITRHHDFAIGNAIKYLWRAGLKDSANEIQDLEKASWYIQDKINQLKKINGQKAK